MTEKQKLKLPFLFYFLDHLPNANKKINKNKTETDYFWTFVL